jgi:hypothetical protein
MDNLAGASDRLVLCLEKAEADLKVVAHRLEEEFNQRYLGKRVSRMPCVFDFASSLHAHGVPLLQLHHSPSVVYMMTGPLWVQANPLSVLHRLQKLQRFAPLTPSYIVSEGQYHLVSSRTARLAAIRELPEVAQECSTLQQARQVPSRSLL